MFETEGKDPRSIFVCLIGRMDVQGAFQFLCFEMDYGGPIVILVWLRSELTIDYYTVVKEVEAQETFLHVFSSMILNLNLENILLILNWKENGKENDDSFSGLPYSYICIM